jgi:protein-tyrosine phosphatase
MIEEDGGNTETDSFRSLYLAELAVEKLVNILDQTFLNVLNRFYIAAKYETINLFKTYDFNGTGWNWGIGGCDTPSVISDLIKEHFAPLEGAKALDINLYQDRHVQSSHTKEQITGKEKFLVFPGDFTFCNVALFMENSLPWIKEESYLSRTQHYVSYVHGDLNGRNIILDHSFNVWLIDFEYTERTHILKDIAKIENDLLYEYTQIESEEMLKEAFIITRQLLKVRDLAEQLPEKLHGLNHPVLVRAWQVILALRRIVKVIVKDDRSSFQMEVVLLRYALFSVSMRNLSQYQKVWALAAACGFAASIEERAVRNKEYRLDIVNLSNNVAETEESGKLAISIIPGRKDHQRALEDDIKVLKESKISRVLCLCTQFEVDKDHLENLRKALEQEGISFIMYPIPKGVVPSNNVCKQLCNWLIDAIDINKENVCIVSLSGLGRPGTLSACYLMSRNLKVDPATAIALVRDGRGPRALDSEAEVNFINSFYTYLKEEAKSCRHTIHCSALLPFKKRSNAVERRSSLSKLKIL